jgi:hypothetical protein
MAENSAALVRHEILQQASAAVLAQANQQPALALTLLREWIATCDGTPPRPWVDSARRPRPPPPC